MQILYFTLAAIALYFGANWILERIEVSVGKRLEYRTLYFFAILLTLALTTFALIRRYTGSAGIPLT